MGSVLRCTLEKKKPRLGKVVSRNVDVLKVLVVRSQMEMRNMLFHTGWKVSFVIKWQKIESCSSVWWKVEFVRDELG